MDEFTQLTNGDGWEGLNFPKGFHRFTKSGSPSERVKTLHALSDFTFAIPPLKFRPATVELIWIHEIYRARHSEGLGVRDRNLNNETPTSTSSSSSSSFSFLFFSEQRSFRIPNKLKLFNRLLFNHLPTTGMPKRIIRGCTSSHHPQFYIHYVCFLLPSRFAVSGVLLSAIISHCTDSVNTFAVVVDCAH